MVMETFIWPTPAGVAGTPTYNVATAQFGDGYRQTAGNGINNKSTTWTMTFTGSADDIFAIKAFLDRQGAVRSFYWTPPLERPILVKGKYTYNHKGGGVHSLSVTFDQDFRP